VAWQLSPDPTASPDDVSATDSLHAVAKASLLTLDAAFANPDVHGCFFLLGSLVSPDYSQPEDWGQIFFSAFSYQNLAFFR
jgi:hypothetical protein